MPIVDVQCVVPQGASVPEGAAAQLATAIGDALRCEPGRLWLRLHVLPDSHYAENGPRGQAVGLPVFVTVLQASPKSGSELQAEAVAVGEAVARVLSRDKARVHIEYAPAGSGRVLFGGHLVR